MKLLRTIRLDPSDTFVFAKAAEPGEWAVPGSFMFIDADIEALGPKERAAFRSGFLGAASFGWSTLAVVSPIRPDEREALVTALAAAFMRELGAPDIDTARAAAEEEIAFSAALCDHPEQTLVAVHRSIEDGEPRERFRTLTPRAEALGAGAPKGGFRAFDFFEVEGDADEVTEHVDLLAMMKDKAR
ncbi:MAG: hypothetical protein HEQ16_03285 [Bosea sp.]|nr:hypothetical protein [Bosea sp. (in: a-proteobacteria)]